MCSRVAFAIEGRADAASAVAEHYRSFLEIKTETAAYFSEQRHLGTLTQTTRRLVRSALMCLATSAESLAKVAARFALPLGNRPPYHLPKPTVSTPGSRRRSTGAPEQNGEPRAPPHQRFRNAYPRPAGETETPSARCGFRLQAAPPALNYEQAVAYMGERLTFGIRLGRERFVELLRRVGNPQERLGVLFHVAGTNGKGSTTTFLAAALRACGYRVGSYLSPYVFDVRERILLNGEMIPHADFARWVTTLRPLIEAIERDTELGPVTEFELKTAVALCWFAERNVEATALEVGLGGRLDATNVAPPPLVAVITTIGLDHQHILGDTLGKIAGEKAGILKRGTRACVTGVPVGGEAWDAIATKAALESVPLIAPLLRGEGAVSLPALRLRGAFQEENARLALAALQIAQETGALPALTEGAIRQGLSEATLPGRFQIARAGDPALVLDVAHNADGARVLAEALRREMPGRRFRFVVGQTRMHEPLPFLENLQSLMENGELIVTAPQFRPKPAEETAAVARSLGLRTTTVEPAAVAIERAWNLAQPGEAVVVTGSFYVVGEVPAFLLR